MRREAEIVLTFPSGAASDPKRSVALWDVALLCFNGSVRIG
jgi:hypothetical protein